jgi:hypothetical protein
MRGSSIPDIPADADVELLQTALRAAASCVEEAYRKMDDVLQGNLIPVGWHDGPECPDAHEFFEQDWLDALDRWEAIKKRIDEQSSGDN